MPRPHKCRQICRPPGVTVFKPAGVPAADLRTVELGLDELEALRLSDLEGLYHADAAERMGIARPTFGRILERARRKVAEALLHSRALVFTGGPVVVAREAATCHRCSARRCQRDGQGDAGACPHCRCPSARDTKKLSDTQTTPPDRPSRRVAAPTP